MNITDGNIQVILSTTSPNDVMFSWTVIQTGTISGATAGSGDVIEQELTGFGTVTYIVTATETNTGCSGESVTIEFIIPDNTPPTEEYTLYVYDISGGEGSGTGRALFAELRDEDNNPIGVTEDITFDWSADSEPVGGGSVTTVGATGLLLTAGSSALNVFTYDSDITIINNIITSNADPSIVDMHNIITGN